MDSPFKRKLKMWTKTIVIWLFICLTLGSIGYYIDQPEIKQKVVENDWSSNVQLNDMIFISSDLDYTLNLNPTLEDSLVHVKKMKQDSLDYLKKQKDIFSPYKLTTSYLDHETVDYGTFHEIDSIKCVRLSEYENNKKKYDYIARKKELEYEKYLDEKDEKERKLDILNSKCL